MRAVGVLSVPHDLLVRTDPGAMSSIGAPQERRMPARGRPVQLRAGGMTVASCLQLTPLNQGIILSGRQGLDRDVSWVHVVDHSDPEDSLAEGELLLTSGIALSQDPHLRADIFKIMLRQNSAALVIALGRYMTEVPQEMLEAGDLHGIPVIGLPWEVNFGDITRAVLAPLLYAHVRFLERSEALGRELLELLLHHADASILCARIATTLGCEVGIFDAEGKVRGECRRSGNADGTAWETVTARLACLGHAQVGAKHMAFGVRLFGIAMPLAGARRAWLVLDGISTPLQHGELLIAEGAAAAVGLLLMQEEALATAAYRPAGERLLDVLDGGVPLSAVLAHELGLLLTEPCVVLIAEARAGRTAEIAPLVTARFAALFGARAMTQRDNILVFVLQKPLGRTKRWMERLETALEEAGRSCRLAVGRPDQAVGELADAYAETAETLRLGRLLRPQANRLHADQMVMLARMARNLTTGAAAQASSPSIKKLEEEGRGLQGSLIETLECLLEADGNVSLAARHLGIHRHTLLYRLGRIREILDIELDSVSRLELRLQLVAWRLAGR